MFDVKFDQMKITANTLIEPGQSPLAARTSGDKDVVKREGFWARLKKKLFHQ